MIRDFLLACFIIFAIMMLAANIYNAGLETQIAVLEERQQIRQDSIAYYRYEFKHSTSGTRRHVGAALGKIVMRMHYLEYVYVERQKILLGLKEQKQLFAKVFW